MDDIELDDFGKREEDRAPDDNNLEWDTSFDDGWRDDKLIRI